MAQALEVDAVIDPAETRRWIAQGLASSAAGVGVVTPYLDAW
jgi:acetyl-CoA carboxylase carboxyltransferase component